MIIPEDIPGLVFGDFPDMDVYWIAYHLEAVNPTYWAALRASIARVGIKEPVLMDGNCVMDGHHRLAIAYELDLPVPTAPYNPTTIRGSTHWHRRWRAMRERLGAAR